MYEIPYHYRQKVCANCVLHSQDKAASQGIFGELKGELFYLRASKAQGLSGSRKLGKHASAGVTRNEQSSF